MRIPIKILDYLVLNSNLESLGLEVDLSEIAAAASSKETVIPLTKTLVAKLLGTNAESVVVLYNPEFEKLLAASFPDQFESPYKESASHIETYLKQFNLANQLSSQGKRIFKPRKITILQEVLFPGSEKKVIAHFNSDLDDKVLELIMSKHKGDYQIKYMTNEKGILLVYDQEGYKDDKQLVRLQFIVRKIFNDVTYKNILAIDTTTTFRDYFVSKDRFLPKLIVFCGRTARNVLEYQKIRIFDPFVKTVWMESNDIYRSGDEIFDGIIMKLSEDYSAEYAQYSIQRGEKNSLSANELQEYRNRIGKFGRSFNLSEYINIANEIFEKSLSVDMFQPESHLENTLESLKTDKSRIFSLILTGA